MKECKIVIGKNFGDEGKGMMTAAFAYQSKSRGNALVIKHNGGAQAGHTVECGGFRFVFHQLGSGSTEGADTYLADSFMVDLLKLAEEIHDYNKCVEENVGYKKVLRVYASKKCRITTVYDVLLNNIAETLRDNPHGSCGMGIHETVLRSEAMPFAIGEIKDINSLKVYLERVRNVYVPGRCEELFTSITGLGKEEFIEKNPTHEVIDWLELIDNDNLLLNVSEDMYDSLVKFIIPIDDKDEFKEFVGKYETYIFEGAQGLMLDMDNMEYFPNLTHSKTGSYNPVRILDEMGFDDKNIDVEVCFITRSYVTRHGNGRLDYECGFDRIKGFRGDKTNVPNPWQKSLRFALHPEASEFNRFVKKDLLYYDGKFNPKVSLLVSHLNETADMMLTSKGYIELDGFLEKGLYQTVYKSYKNDYREKTVFTKE